MKKQKFILMSFFMLISLFILSSCKTKNNYDNDIKVVFNLEGGSYLSSDQPIVYYYPDEGKAQKIFEVQTVSNREITRPGYKLEGWYKIKTGEGENVVYSEKWDFENDTFAGKELNLYAHWIKNAKHTYEVCYRDSNGMTQVLGAYNASVNGVGMAFKDANNYIDQIYDNGAACTGIGYLDENGNPWDSNFKHPAGEEDLCIRVYVDYIQGEYQKIRTVEELNRYKKNSNLYLMNDIDCKGTALSFDNYKYILEGAGHKIYNFKISPASGKNDLKTINGNDKSLAVSIFYKTENAVIKNVSFEDATFVLDSTNSMIQYVYVSPITEMVNTRIENVQVAGSFTVVNKPRAFDDNNLTVVQNRIYLSTDEESVVLTTTVNIVIEETN